MTERTHPTARVQTICLLILTGLALSAAARIFSPVLLPFVVAVLLTYCLTPIVDAQRRWMRLPRGVAIVTTIILGCALLVLFGLVVTSAVRQIRDNWQHYREQMDLLLERVAERLPIEHLVPGGDTLEGESLTSLLQIPSDTISTLVTGAASGVMNLLSNGILVLIFMIFLMAGRRSDAPAGGVLHDIEQQTKRYIITMVFTSGLTGTLVGVTLYVLGVEFALLFGFLTFLLNFIPNFGSVIATLLPVPVVLLNPELSPAAKIAAIAIPGCIQFVIGNLAQPKIMGRSLDLHPVVVLMALIFFGLIWGIVGMFIATPITAVLRILFEKLEYTRPLASLMAGNIEGFGGQVSTAPEQA